MSDLSLGTVYIHQADSKSVADREYAIHLLMLLIVH